MHGRVKSERSGKDMDDDDLTDDERKDDLLGNHMHHMLGGGFGLKPEIKNTDCGIPLPPSKPKIWSLADTAACKTPPPPPPSQQQWLGSNGFALPSSTRYGGGGFLPGHCQQGFPDVQTDTPPQTPPSMKLPSVAGNLLPGAGGPCIGSANTNAGGYSQPSFLGGFSRIQSPQRPQQSVTQPGQMGAPVGDNAAFKPFYKRWVVISVTSTADCGMSPVSWHRILIHLFLCSPQPMTGGFVSPVWAAPSEPDRPSDR